MLPVCIVRPFSAPEWSDYTLLYNHSSKGEKNALICVQSQHTPCFQSFY